MRKLIFVPAIALLFVLPGCVRTPEFREDVLTTTDVVLNIKCELRNALRKMRPQSGWLTTPDKSWAAGFTVTMNVVARSDLGAEAGFVIPLTPGIFSVALTAGGMTQATRTETFDFTENLGGLLAFDRCPQDIVNDHHILLEGRLGFEDILGRVLASRDVAKLQLTSLAYNLDFDIEKGGSVGPSFSLIPIGGSNTFGGGITLAGKRTNSNTLRVVFSPPVLSTCHFPAVLNEFKVCPQLVMVVEGDKKGILDRSGRRGAVPGGGTERTIDRGATQQRLDNLKGRNVLEGTLNELRNDGLVVD